MLWSRSTKIIMAIARTTTKVIVVGGGGTIGSSTALHLIRSGYTASNITVLDTYPFPSAQSAGNDLNKIMGIRVSNKAEIQLSLEALDMWRNDELFKPFFHNTGRVFPVINILAAVQYANWFARWIVKSREKVWTRSAGSMNLLSTRDWVKPTSGWIQTTRSWQSCPSSREAASR